MKVIVQDKIFKVDPSVIGGMLALLDEENYDEINLSMFSPAHFDIFLNLSSETLAFISTKQLTHAFQIAHYLNSSDKMAFFGKAIAKRIEKSSFNDIKRMSTYFCIKTY